MVRTWLTTLLLVAAAGPLLVPPAAAQEARIIVRLRAESAKSAMTSKARIAKAADRAGLAVRHVRPMALGADIVAVVGSPADAEQAALRLAASPDVEFAEVDHRRHAMQTALVSDIFAAQQRYLRNDPTSISAFSAWDVTHGSSSVIVAVVDSGYRPHAAMAGRLLPGYDMVSDPLTANDGDGRDADASDPGDWISATDAADDFSGCRVRSSEWHGTGVAGIIGANTNDGSWTAGIDWNARLLPVRVLGKCGGYDSDVADGIAWAAGLDVPGVPANPTPAQVINVSLGASTACPSIYQGLAAAAFAHGVTRAIVAAAGNEAQDVANSSPANCPGFLAIASTTGVGGKLAGFSNFGSGVTLSAPGGSTNFRTPADSVIFLSNTGTTIPVADTITNVGGTSVSAPMVSGTISLMLAVAPWLTPDQVRAILVATAKPFPATSDCTTDRCGAGILDAGAAVRAAAVAPAPPTINYEGLWWNAPANSEAGWGLNVAHQGDVIFATWFTYDANGKAWWLAMTANKTSPNVFSGTLYQTHGPAFNAAPFNPALVTASAVGTGTLTFS